MEGPEVGDESEPGQGGLDAQTPQPGHEEGVVDLEPAQSGGPGRAEPEAITQVRAFRLRRIQFPQGHPVHDRQMPVVAGVLGEFLGGGVDLDAPEGRRNDSARGRLRGLPGGPGTVGRVPAEDHAVAFVDRMVLHPRTRGPAVGRCDACAVRGEGEVMEGAYEVQALDGASGAEVGAEVRAVGVHRIGRSVVGAVEDHVLARQPPGQDAAGGQLAGERQEEPAARVGEFPVRWIHLHRHDAEFSPER